MTFESKGFAFLRVIGIKVGEKVAVIVTAILELWRAVETFGVISIMEPVETTTTTFNGDLIWRLPH
jgi:hypothetical protein